MRYHKYVRIRMVLSSNYPCLGKDSLLAEIEKQTTQKATEVRVGDLIKSDAREIVALLNEGQTIEEIAPQFDITAEGLESSLSDMTEEELKTNNPFVKSPGQRLLQQDLGLFLASRRILGRETR